LYYYLSPEAKPFSLPVDEPVVTELPFRPKDAPMEGELLALFQASGFHERLRRARLERPAGPGQASDAGFAFRPAEAADGDAALSLLTGCFDPLTGCLPTGEELAEDIAAGNLLCALDEDGSLAGLLHSRRAKASAEVRHLAVRPDLRGRHCARSLLAAWLAQTGDCKARVWTGAANAAALHTYQQGGFQRDGWYSVVLAAGD
jgi:GNAT superfamily N-acetyltransferase